jgi:Ca2+-binding RTX toxin-like protein
LAKPATAISLAFGNDDPNVTDTSDQAKLTLYRGAAEVGEVSVNVNANDLMDQRIAHHGAVFNRATFQYVNAADVPKNLIEIVDDIVVGPLCTVVGNNNNNNLVGTSGRDVFCAEGGSDTIRGLGGDDLVYAGSGSDEVRAGAGADTVVGAAGRDRLSGGSGRDHLNGGTGRDHCNGGPGADTATRCEVKRRIP